MTEAAAKEEGIDVVTGKVNMVSNARTLIETDNRSFIKIVVDKITHEIIGAQLMCRRASDIASEFVVVINNKITVEKLKESVHPHPSFSEAIFDVLDVLDSKLNGI
jgi:dihydrolipoamide dehydrogenase